MAYWHLIEREKGNHKSGLKKQRRTKHWKASIDNDLPRFSASKQMMGISDKGLEWNCIQFHLKTYLLRFFCHPYSSFEVLLLTFALEFGLKENIKDILRCL